MVGETTGSKSDLGWLSACRHAALFLQRSMLRTEGVLDAAQAVLTVMHGAAEMPHVIAVRNI
jgi:hypothetical protein